MGQLAWLNLLFSKYNNKIGLLILNLFTVLLLSYHFRDLRFCCNDDLQFLPKFLLSTVCIIMYVSLKEDVSASMVRGICIVYIKQSSKGNSNINIP